MGREIARVDGQKRQKEVRRVWWIVTWYAFSCCTFNFVSLSQRNQEENEAKELSDVRKRGGVWCRPVLRLGILGKTPLSLRIIAALRDLYAALESNKNGTQGRARA